MVFEVIVTVFTHLCIEKYIINMIVLRKRFESLLISNNAII